MSDIQSSEPQSAENANGTGNRQEDQAEMIQVPKMLAEKILHELEDIKKELEELKEMKEKVKEIGVLRKEVQDLKKNLKSKYRIQNQAFYKPYMNFIKTLFSKSPWLDTDSEEFKSKVKSHVGDNAFKTTCLKDFAKKKFIAYRNIIKTRMFKKRSLKKDLMKRSVDDLCKTLYSGELTPENGDSLSTERKGITMLLRNFLSISENPVWDSFWDEFKEYYDMFKLDEKNDKWEILERDVKEKILEETKKK